MLFWQRGVRVDVAGLEIQGPRIDFDLIRTSSSVPDTGTVTLWNVNPDTQGAIEREGEGIEVLAGYDGRLDPIANGIVRRVTLKRDLLDRRLTLSIGDRSVDPAVRGGVTTKAYRGTAWIGTIVVDAVQDMSLVPGDLSILPDDNVVDFSWSGRSASLLDVLLHPRNIDWFIDGDLVLFTRIDVPDDAPPVRIARDTGMIESPTVTERGARVTVLLTPSLSLASPVVLESDVVNGDFKLVAINHRGSSRKGGFHSECELWSAGAS